MSQNISVEDNKKTIGRLFDSIARRYDLLNHLLTLNIDKFWRRQTVKRINQAKFLTQTDTVHVLDVATGTGDLAVSILKSFIGNHEKALKRKTPTEQTDNLSYHLHLTGIDLSEQMLNIGKKKVNGFISSYQTERSAVDNRNNTVNIRGLQVDCDMMLANVENLPFDDNHFAVVTCGFGVRNFNHLDKGLQEMYRILQPNGQIVILEFAYPQNPFVRFFYNLYFTYVLPFVGKIISKDNTAYKYLMQSVKEFPKGDGFLSRLNDCGFQNAEFHSLTLGIANIYTAYKPD